MKRRDAIGVMLAGCAAPMLSSQFAFARGMRSNPINPPAGPMQFTRTLERSLGDGRAIAVTRSFTVRFARVNEEFELSGRQGEVVVDLPEQLAAFAELERSRDDSAIFPIMLNRSGEIMSGFAPPPMSEQVDEAVMQTLAHIDSQGHPAEDRARLRQFATAVHNAGGSITAHMPVDLFSPSGGRHEHQQELGMADELTGVVRTVFTGEIDPQTRIMRTAQRVISTEIADEVRTTRELWSLGLA